MFVEIRIHVEVVQSDNVRTYVEFNKFTNLIVRCIHSYSDVTDK